MLPRHVTFLAKAEYFTTPGLKGRLTRWFFKGVKQIPIDRSNSTAATAALHTGLKLLQEGEFLGIYPEGTRSPDGRLYRGKTGVARLALESQAPVIPVAMINTDKVQPIGKVLPRIHRVEIHLGKPLTFAQHHGQAGEYHTERAVTDTIMAAIAELSGQERVNEYAVRPARKKQS